MKLRATNRGFSLLEFKDSNGVDCSLQESSVVPRIWLGCNDPNPKVFTPGDGWRDLELGEGVLCTTRMHLTQDQVRELLPYLQRFADTGMVAPSSSL